MWYRLTIVCVIVGPHPTLWVGTAGGTLGVFTISRDDGQELVLEGTGEYPHMKLMVFIIIFMCR